MSNHRENEPKMGADRLVEIRPCYLCGASLTDNPEPGECGMVHVFTDVGPQRVHESCYESARDAWEDACREAAIDGPDIMGVE